MTYEERHNEVQALKAEAHRAGYSLWAQVAYEDIARAILARLLRTLPGSEPSIGLCDDGSWVIWYKGYASNLG